MRVSIHPTMRDDEIDLIIHALQEIHKNYDQWQSDYEFNLHTGEFELKGEQPFKIDIRNSYKSTK